MSRKFPFTTSSASGALKRLMVTLAGGALAMGAVWMPNRADALLLFTVKQIGDSTVVVTGSGSYDTTGLTIESTPPPSPAVSAYPVNPFVVGAISTTRPGLSSGANFLLTGTNLSSGFLWRANLTRTSDLGTNSSTFDAASSTGTVAGIDESYLMDLGYSYIILPTGNACTNPLTCTISNTSTYTGTIASLGLTPGTYSWTWGTSADQKLTIYIEAPAPLPVLGAASAFGWSRRLRRRIRGRVAGAAGTASNS